MPQNVPYRSAARVHRDRPKATSFTLLATDNTPPPDAIVQVGGVDIWFDGTAGAPKIMYKAKDLAGAVTSGQLGGGPPPVPYLLTGPASGMIGSPSAPFTVDLNGIPVGGSGVHVAPNDGGAGGTFNPTSVLLTNSSPTAIFNYTAAASGSYHIGTTNDGGLTNPAPITYTAAAGLADGASVNLWPDSSGNGHDATMTGSNRPIFKTGVAGSLALPVVRFSTAGASYMTLAAPITVPSVYDMFLFGRCNSNTTALYTLTSDATNGTLGVCHIAPADGDYLFWSTTADVGYLTPNPYRDGLFHLILAAISGTGAGLFVDAVAQAATFGAGASPGTTFTKMGIRFDPLHYSDADISEMILFAPNLSSPNRNNMQQYFSNKYGLGLSVGTAVDPSTLSPLAWWKSNAALS